MARIIRADADAYLLEEMAAADAERAIGTQRIAAIIVVPEDFDVAAARADAAVDLYLNNVDIDLADDLRRSVTRSVAEFDAPLLALGFLTHHIPFCAEDSGAPLWLALLLSGPCGWMLPPVSWTHGLALVALLGAVTLATVGLGTLLGVALRDTRLVTMTGLNASAYLFFLGGGFSTVAFLPHWLQVASRFVPTSYAIEGLRQALFYPELTGFGHDLLVLTGCAALSIVLASTQLARAWRRGWRGSG